MFFIFFIIFFVNRINNALEKDTSVATLSEVPKLKTIPNYLPFIFHVVIALLVLTTLFSYKLISEERIEILINDISFQFYSTLLLVIIGLISPFTKLRKETNEKLQSLADTMNNPIIKWLADGNNLQITKIVACIVVVFYFVYNEYIKLPALNDSLFSSVAIFLIFFYLFNNIVQLFRNPVQFRKSNMLRLSVLFNSIKTSFFVLIGTVVLVFIPSAIMGLKFVDEFNPLIIALLGYNIIMAHNEYKVLKLLHQPNN
ncbi:hypothetical protein [Pedobacter xixiisoli]|uniref:Uncharacterized protein n=1 Tax=Pedobacter xixiisoli TaxID=1476464 RepID=A0A285ZTG1_9SPHI|nr:hypothetical protein [Pedobacter xixiisoli]SOD12928.1 hypothetical protein SAMN06297358_0920 [Pedobacter xixiisoli]